MLVLMPARVALLSIWIVRAEPGAFEHLRGRGVFWVQLHGLSERRNGWL